MLINDYIKEIHVLNVRIYDKKLKKNIIRNK